MSSKNERGRTAFHRRQMDALPTLISGLDPDPPVLLCPRTERFDGLVCQELRAAGWPASGKTAEQRKANPPAPVKGAILARKLATGNGLASNDVNLLAERIAWLQRNWFRWSARDGYQVLAASKAQEQVVPTGPKKVGQKPPPEVIGEAVQGSEFEADANPRRDLFEGTSARISLGSKEAQTAEPRESSSSILAAATGKSEGQIDTNEGPTERGKRPAEESQIEGSVDKFDAALASLRAGSESEDVPSFDDYARAAGEGGSDKGDDPLITLRTGNIKSVEGDKVRSFLFAIYYKEPGKEIERRASALAADRAQLSDALSRQDSTSQDIREAFAKLGLDADA